MAGALSAAMLLGTGMQTAAAAEQPNISAQNVIIMIPDGMGMDGTTLTRWYNGGEPLAMDEMASGLVRTYSADAAIADSAPAGTAFATGHKSHTGYVGVLPDETTMPGLDPIAEGDAKKPVANVLEAARLAGKSTGIIATSEIMHATPAAFSAHYPDRGNYDALSEQQVYAGIDVVLGGGAKYFTPAGRKDGEDLQAVIRDLGYDLVKTPAELTASDSDKLWGMFADTAMSYDMDRDPSKQPSLAEMTSKAIDVLDRNEEGFFLMVEGSKVDWAAHANDPIGIISDVNAFDKAVAEALAFAKEDGNTMVIAVTDHGNGGISIGDRATTGTYDEEPLETFTGPLLKAKLTGEGVEAKLASPRTNNNIKQVMAEYYGITDLTNKEVETIRRGDKGKLNSIIGPMISERAHIGWTSGGHTGGDVVLYSYAPNGQRLSGVLENTDIARAMASALGVDLDAVTERLFVPAEAAFEAKGAEWEIDDSDKANPVLVVTKGEDTLRLPVYKNIAELNGEEVTLDGSVVDNGERIFVPQDAVDLLP
ncbi:alkaline phosphatase [Saccharibacillus alkalitolerans]|uniref:Alkaline phosphatase n=1 Tax=Saccharibacillus alkalitolerans TaxID=2705290 RepID=A0ABX0F3S8_9BACL|nr:alkaline phosphatase [Saccharibacillus alkalitolerans]NGZ75028.1 alkaline phosphatase [Saccharibacillus alkalitolerans]